MHKPVSTPPSTPLNRAVKENVKECDIININMRRDHTSATFETYNLKMDMFKNRNSEELLNTAENFKTKIDGTGNTTAAGIINYLRTILHVEALR